MLLLGSPDVTRAANPAVVAVALRVAGGTARAAGLDPGNTRDCSYARAYEGALWEGAVVGGVGGSWLEDGVRWVEGRKRVRLAVRWARAATWSRVGRVIRGRLGSGSVDLGCGGSGVG